MKKQNFGITRKSNFWTMVSGALVMGALMTVSPAQAEVSCHLINGKAVGQDLGGGRTAGATIGGGLLQGTIAGTIVGTGITGTVASFQETVIFTNSRGTLTVVVTGGIDVTTGQFNGSGPITAATGKLSGATGNLSLSGAVNFATGIFSEDVSGVICADLAP
jgi:hypothetical protein